MRLSKPVSTGASEASGRCCSTNQSLAKKLPDVPLDAQQMRHLADDGDADEAFDEPAHHRRGDEGRHPAHAQRAEEQEEGADQDREGGGERIELRSSLRRDGAHGQRGDQAGRGVRADDQQARGAEQRVGNQRRDDRVEPHDRRHPDDAGIGHALRHHDRPDREAGQDIRQQPLAPVGGKPAEDGQQPPCDGGCALRSVICGLPRTAAEAAVQRAADAQQFSSVSRLILPGRRRRGPRTPRAQHVAVSPVRQERGASVWRPPPVSDRGGQQHNQHPARDT